MNKEVLCVILGGGRGTRLYPLTKYRSKPAVPLAGKYRLIDIPISNCLNSAFYKIFILTQFNSESLNRHIFRTYKLDSFSQGFVEILAAEQSQEHADWFQGSADAVRKCLKHFSDPNTQHILILSGDQLYRMDFARMLDAHIKCDAEITVACNPVALEESSELGIVGIADDFRMRTFVEKPKDLAVVTPLAFSASSPDKQFLASMGIYIFNKGALIELLSNGKAVDFGRDVIPQAIKERRTYAFVHKGYWKDIGSIDAFYRENLAFTEDVPPLDLFEEEWQFFTRPRYLPLTKLRGSFIECSSIAEGALIAKARIMHSVIGLRSVIGDGSVIEDSILMGNDFYEKSTASTGASVTLGIGPDCHIRKAIVDKNVRIGAGVKIRNERSVRDFENQYCIIREGITIIPKNTVIPPGTIL